MDDLINQKAIALRYDLETDQAPVVVAKGCGLIAENIVKIAQENDVPLKEDKELTDYLMSLKLYEEIPPDLYPVIAEVLAFIYRMDKEL
ncbi:MAG TPA: EscU/YscU/HrcU family type III secretion system export apparatus switch protein [Syntrophomonadaceae bacterium]|nr:EscU/YscU/HrcU family type III secretion system export apparatus switch protein [Syntrophomonadaceae bacterium]